LKLGFAVGIIFAFTVVGFLSFTPVRSLPSYANATLLVIPFKNLTSSDFDDYLAHGFTNELRQNLRGLDEIRIINTPPDYTGNNNAYSDIVSDSEVNVNLVLRGDVKKEGDQIKITSQLLRLSDNTIIWQKKYDESYNKLHFILYNIFSNIAFTLNLDGNHSFPDSRLTNSNAFDMTLKANYLLDHIHMAKKDPWKLYIDGTIFSGKGTQKANVLAITLFDHAISLDPNNARSYLGLANCYLNYLNYGWDEDEQYILQAEKLIDKAQKIEPYLSEYFSLMAKLHLINYFRHDKYSITTAVRSSKEGLTKYPNDPNLNAQHAQCLFFQYGQNGDLEYFKKALQQMETCYSIDPFGNNNIFYTQILMLDRQFNRAFHICRSLAKNDDSGMAQFRLGEILYYMGDLKHSIEIFQRIESPLDMKIGSILNQAMITSQEGDMEQTLKLLAQLNNYPPKNCYGMNEIKYASIYLGLGRTEEGYKHLESLINRENLNKMSHIFKKYIEIDRNFDMYRNEYKFKKMLK